MNHTNKENCFKLFSEEKLTQAIQVTKNSALGPDDIHKEKLKHLPPEGLDSLLALYNKTWQQGYFPETWLEPTLIPISRPGKYPTGPSIYRPIALASVLCKINEI